MEMTSTSSIVLQVVDPSGPADARRRAAELARWLDFGDVEAGRLAIVVTEMAGNLVKHASRGLLVIQGIHEDGWGCIEVISIDQGPGMADVSACMRDGYSTSGSPGTGLGAIARLSASFDIHSVPGKGTVMVARMPGREARRPAPSDGFAVDGISIHLETETVSGDAWALASRDTPRILVVDGLGHGPAAAGATAEAVRAFRASKEASLEGLIDELHHALLTTRGAAGAVAEVDRRQGILRFCGVGNIAGKILGPGQERHLVSMNGTLGYELHRVREFTYPWSPDSILILSSDGILTHWTLEDYPGILLRQPATIAAVLLRDFSRKRDDATVVVAKEGG